MSRRMSDEAQKIFDKYVHNFVRRLTKEKAVEMLQNDFGLCHERADFMFHAFVLEGNNVMTANDFNNFYMCFGKQANVYLDQYKAMEQKGNGTADISDLFDFLLTLQTQSGRNPSQEEVEQFIKTSAGESKTINQNKFANLVMRIKMTRK